MGTSVQAAPEPHKQHTTLTAVLALRLHASDAQLRHAKPPHVMSRGDESRAFSALGDVSAFHRQLDDADRSGEIRNLLARFDSFAEGLARKANTPDQPLSLRYALQVLSIAERLEDLGAPIGLHHQAGVPR